VFFPGAGSRSGFVGAFWFCLGNPDAFGRAADFSAACLFFCSLRGIKENGFEEFEAGVTPLPYESECRTLRPCLKGIVESACAQKQRCHGDAGGPCNPGEEQARSKRKWHFAGKLPAEAVGTVEWSRLFAALPKLQNDRNDHNDADHCQKCQLEGPIVRIAVVGNVEAFL